MGSVSLHSRQIRTLTPQIEDAIESRLRAGETVREVARRERIGRGTVADIRKRLSLPEKVAEPKRIATPQRKINPTGSSAWTERVLPQFSEDLPLQRCARLSATLTQAACSERWKRGEKGDQANHYAPCKGCPIGRRNTIAQSSLLRPRPQADAVHGLDGKRSAGSDVGGLSAAFA
jgi:hypothetical protein